MVIHLTLWNVSRGVEGTPGKGDPSGRQVLVFRCYGNCLCFAPPA